MPVGKRTSRGAVRRSGTTARKPTRPYSPRQGLKNSETGKPVYWRKIVRDERKNRGSFFVKTHFPIQEHYSRFLPENEVTLLVFREGPDRGGPARESDLPRFFAFLRSHHLTAKKKRYRSRFAIYKNGKPLLRTEMEEIFGVDSNYWGNAKRISNLPVKRMKKNR